MQARLITEAAQMALNLGTITLTGQERTCSVSRALPANGQFCITIEREILFKDEAGVVNARNAVSPAMAISIRDLLKSPAAAAYLVACNTAPSLLHLMQAESVLYDALVQERKEVVAAAALRYRQDQEAAAAQIIADQLLLKLLLLFSFSSGLPKRFVLQWQQADVLSSCLCLFAVA
jgi:hypothetical protein